MFFAQIRRISDRPQRMNGQESMSDELRGGIPEQLGRTRDSPESV